MRIVVYAHNHVQNKSKVNQIRGIYLKWTLVHTTIGDAVFFVAERISKQQSSEVGAIRGRLSLDPRSVIN